MLSFALTGVIGAVLTTAPDELTLAISSTLDRPNQPPRTAWVLCVVREPELRAKLSGNLRVGDWVRIDGEIEQRRRQVGALAFHSVGFAARSVEKTSSPASGAAS